MRVTRTIAAGMFLGWMCQSSLASPPNPGVDRPTPPPCCADGQCFASPLTYGYYDTRWRRWPLEQMAQTAKGRAGAQVSPLPPEMSPFNTPPAEQEDRKAPPPSVPAGEQTPAGATGGTPRTPGGPGAPTNPPGTPPTTGQPRGASSNSLPGFPAPPSTAPIAPPAGQGTQPSTEPLYKHVPADSPLNRNSPQGDADPPPSLPFGPALVAPEQPPREVSQQPAAIPRRSPSVKQVNAPSSDPPPAPPIALASYQE